MESTKGRRKTTMTLRAGEVLVLIDHLECLALVYRVLGHPEDAQAVLMQAEILNRRIHVKKKE